MLVVFGFIVFECGIDLMVCVEMCELCCKFQCFGELFIQFMDECCGVFGFELVSLCDFGLCGSQVFYVYFWGYEIVQVLKECDLIGDFCVFDVLCFGLMLFYLCYCDVFDVVEWIYVVCVMCVWD